MDIALVITEFLKDKVELRDFENDSLSIVDNHIASWDFKNIPCPTEEELKACEEKVAIQQAKDDVLKQIKDLEDLITPRRIREALISKDFSLISRVEEQIAMLRKQL